MRDALQQETDNTPIPSTKTELLDAITSSFELLLIDLGRVSDCDACIATMDGHVAGTEMSPAHLVSYLRIGLEMVAPRRFGRGSRFSRDGL